MMKQLQRWDGIYERFRCIAEKCPDSCCAGWAIVVDEAAQEKYQTMTGPLGEKLRQEMITDEDGDCIFRMNAGRCPFWETSGLCEIHRLAGETALCHTCDAFPRLVQDYGDFAEKSLSFACPEAARLMLMQEDFPDFTEQYAETEEDAADYDPQEMTFLKAAREQCFAMLRSEEKPFFETLQDLLLYACQLQDIMDFGDIEEPVPDYQAECCDEPLSDDTARDFLGIYESMTHLTDAWEELLSAVAELPIQPVPFSADAFAEETRCLQLYVYYGLYRYFLSSINDWDVLQPIKHLICNVLMIHRMVSCVWQEKETLTFADMVRLVQLYDKEVEHNAENVEQLAEACMDCDCCTTEQLIALLRSC